MDAQDSRSLGMYKSFWLKTGFHQAKVLFKKGYTISVSSYYKQVHNMSYGSNKMSLTQCSNHSNYSSKLLSFKKYIHTPKQMLENRGAQSCMPFCPDNYILYVILSMELTSCHPSGTYNFVVASRFLENL